MASEFKKLTVDADNGTFTFEVVDGEARDAAQKAKAAAEAIKIPTALPNPKKLTFTGGATGTYDGSQEVTINIPTGGGGTVTDEQIASAVEDYFAKNPVDVSSIVWRGEWDEAVLYSIGDAVSYNGSSYVCIKKNVPDGIAPDDSGIDWMLLAEKGDPGDKYVLTPADKQEIAEQAAELVEVPEGGTVTDEQIASAVEDYFAENPVQGGGLSETAKNLFITILRNGVYSTDQSANITALAAEFGVTEEEPDVPDVPDIPDEPDEPEKTLTSISATYSGGDVTAGTAVTALTGIVVTAHYSDGSTAKVTGYTLSGTIAEGNNTITVSYSGKTTTITVTGVAESGGDETVTWEPLTMNYSAVEGYMGSQGAIYSDGGETSLGAPGRGVYYSEVFEADTDVSVTVSVSGIVAYAGHGTWSGERNSGVIVYNAISIASGKTETIEMKVPIGHRVLVCGNYSQHMTVEASKKVVA